MTGRTPRTHLASTLLALSAAAVAACPAAGAAPPDRVTLPGGVHPLARPELSIGRTDPRLPMERIVVALARRPGARERLEALLAAQQDPASPRFHRWLTPEEFGTEFGLGDGDLARVAGWLRAQGFAVGPVARGRGWIEVSGTAAVVERAFAVEMRDYRTAGGEIHHANAAPPSVPRALAGLVRGIVSLHDFPLRPASPLAGHASPGASARAAAPAAQVAAGPVVRPPGPAGQARQDPRYDPPGGGHLLAPADLATIYHLQPLYDAGLDGTGQAIAVVGRTDIRVEDVRAFRAFFGLPANDPVLVHNGADPGIVNVFDEGESDLDVEWAGATAPRAAVRLVVSASTGVTDGIALSAQYAVDQDVAPIVTTSYGQCEPVLGDGALGFWGDLWAQAAAQGITVFVAAGDSGAAGCDSPNSARGSRAAVNGLCSPPNDVCVGGTALDDGGNPGAYWSATNDPVTRGSARSYIPEVAWNESGTTAGGSGLWASGGGASTFFAKPPWQTVPGVPDDGARDVPDLALAAARSAAYVYFEEGRQLSIGGTSGASPALAGIMALIVQRSRQRQGNANPALYKLGTEQFLGRQPPVFHDVAAGDNGVPGIGGFGAGPGYDQVTGLGSVDGAALAVAWPGGRAGGCVPGEATLCIDDQPGDGRFELVASYAAAAQSGDATAVPLAGLGVAQGGLFWFFARTNPELLVKVIDACAFNGKLWVFSAATTNVGFTLTVTDTLRGRSRQYTNPPDTPAAPVQDVAAFDCG